MQEECACHLGVCGAFRVPPLTCSSRCLSRSQMTPPLYHACPPCKQCAHCQVDPATGYPVQPPVKLQSQA
jgi:hypothetical protein